MKLLFHLASTAVFGGSVRVLYNKVRWLVDRGGYEIVIVTTDQHGGQPYFDFPASVKMIDLGINYWDDYSKNPLARTWLTLRKQRMHRRKLAEVLRQERPDITFVHYPTEAWVAADIRDGSPKVMEFHTSRYFRLQETPQGLHRLVARYRSRQDRQRAKRFSTVVVLTEEDREQWGLPGLRVIPNAAPQVNVAADPGRSRTVIAVGRLIPLKRFDQLLEAWAMLPAELRSCWQLKIFGDGHLEEPLKQQALSLGIGDSVQILPSTGDIYTEYANAALLTMTSQYEGLSMVMLEALSVGLPMVSYSFKCGPRDLIDDGENGYIVPLGDVKALSAAMQKLMRDDALRDRMSRAARRKAEAFQEARIMEKWEALFHELTDRKI